MWKCRRFEGSSQFLVRSSQLFLIEGERLIRVVLPQHLRTLAGVDAEVSLDVDGPVTAGRVLDALEARFPMLKGTIREYGTGQRRAYMRFFACAEDWSHAGMDAELPSAVAEGEEPLLIVGAIAGG